MSLIRRSIVPFLISLIGLSACTVQRPHRGDTTPMTEEEKAMTLASFDEVWTTIRDRHFDPTLNGVDWEAVRTELRPQIEAATTQEESRRVMMAAIDRLGQSHFGIIPSEAYRDVSGEVIEDEASDESAASASGQAAAEIDEEETAEGTLGIHARVINGQAYVFRVDQGSSAAAAGVKPGWRIDRVRKSKLASIIRNVGEVYEGQVKQRAMQTLTANAVLAGKIGQEFDVKFTNERGRSEKLRLRVGEYAGEVAKFGFLPPMNLVIEDRVLDSGVGYVAWSIFFNPPTVMPWFIQKMKDYREAPGIIIDLRGNIGGIGAMAMGIGNQLVLQRDQKLGTMSSRDTNLKFVLNPQASSFRGPVAVLVDELSMSTSEILAGGLQALGRARVFGVRSPGMALPSQIVKLPNGDGFQFATANYTSANGQVLEGHGVVPDEVVEPDPALLSQGRDAIIEAAEAWILSQQGTGS